MATTTWAGRQEEPAARLYTWNTARHFRSLPATYVRTLWHGADSFMVQYRAAFFFFFSNWRCRCCWKGICIYSRKSDFHSFGWVFLLRFFGQSRVKEEEEEECCIVVGVIVYRSSNATPIMLAAEARIGYLFCWCCCGRARRRKNSSTPSFLLLLPLLQGEFHRAACFYYVNICNHTYARRAENLPGLPY